MEIITSSTSGIKHPTKKAFLYLLPSIWPIFREYRVHVMPKALHLPMYLFLVRALLPLVVFSSTHTTLSLSTKVRSGHPFLCPCTFGLGPKPSRPHQPKWITMNKDAIAKRLRHHVALISNSLATARLLNPLDCPPEGQ